MDNARMNAKYEFVSGENFTTQHGRTMHRIRALRAIERFGVRSGDKGGWIELEANLSQHDDAWVSDSARVFGEAQVFGSARVFGEAQVFGSAMVFGFAQVFGKAQVYDSTRVFGEAQVSNYAMVFGSAQVLDFAQVFGNAQVFGDALVFGDAQVFGDAHVFGSARVFGDARVFGSAHVFGSAQVFESARLASDADILCVGPIGSRGAPLTIFRHKDCGVMVVTGCYHDTLDRFAVKVEQVHATNPHGLAYRAAIALARVKFGAPAPEPTALKMEGRA
jgi:hypothetical protein